MSKKDTFCQKCAASNRNSKLVLITYYGGGIPQVGDIALAKQLGYKDRGLRYYDACPICGKGRWVRNTNRNSMCASCSGKNKHCVGITAGKVRIKRCYKFIHIHKNDPLFAMVNAKTKTVKGGWVLEHRLVMARHINRPLLTSEVVHHINGIKTDNRIENLSLMSESSHNSHLVAKSLQERIQLLEKRITLLEAEAEIMRAKLSGSQDSAREQNIQHYNTLSNLEKQIEDIVQSSSNGDI